MWEDLGEVNHLGDNIRLQEDEDENGNAVADAAATVATRVAAAAAARAAEEEEGQEEKTEEAETAENADPTSAPTRAPTTAPTRPTMDGGCLAATGNIGFNTDTSFCGTCGADLNLPPQREVYRVACCDRSLRLFSRQQEECEADPDSCAEDPERSLLFDQVFP